MTVTGPLSLLTSALPLLKSDADAFPTLSKATVTSGTRPAG